MLWQIFVVSFLVAGKHGCEAVNGRIAITNNAVLRIYADGQLVQTHTGQSQQPWTYTGGASTRVMAFHADITSGNSAGILASFNTGALTNENAKCLTLTGTNPDTEVEGWQNTNFVASGWPNAVFRADNLQSASSPFFQVQDISSSADWIWTSDTGGKDIICRVRLQ